MSLTFNGLYRFDDFEVNPSQWSFRHRGEPVGVSPKAFEVLLYLVSNPGRVVTKDELLKAVWPDAFVEENNLTQQISSLRKALAGKSNYIVTVPGRGYQFTAKVQAVNPAEPSFTTEEGEFLVQRVRERTRVVIEDSVLTVPPLLQAEGSSFPSNVLRLPESRAVTPDPQRWKTAGAVGGLVAVALLAGYVLRRRMGHARPESPVAIAVLPFSNLTGDPGKEYLCDGVTEEMINALAQAGGSQLRVIARTSSMSYRSSPKAAPQIAEELGVQYVLEGSIQSQGTQLHVTAQLIRGDDQTYSWADTFDGNSGEMLDFENRMTASVAKALSLTLLPGEKPERGPVNSAAHDAYLQGLYALSQRSRPGLEKALQSFGTAVALDPQYARAYAELADTYNLMGQFSWMDTAQAHSQAQAAALEALATDANLAEGHAALGFNQWFYEWNPAAGEKELLQAIQLESTNVDAHHWYALLLMTSGRLAEAEQQMHAALALDPKALVLRTNLGWVHYTERNFPLAIQEMRSVLKDDPDFLTAHYKLWWAYSASGNISGAWSELKTVAHLVCTPEDEKKILAAYAQHGYAAALKAMVAPGNGYYSEGLVDNARCMAFAGDRAGALNFLAAAVKNREGWMIFVEGDPAFDSLRSDPEYSRLMRELHAVSDGRE